MALATYAANASSGRTPSNWSRNRPREKSITVGRLLILSWSLTPGSASTSTLTNTARGWAPRAEGRAPLVEGVVVEFELGLASASAFASAASARTRASSFGVRTLHGPHQLA